MTEADYCTQLLWVTHTHTHTQRCYRSDTGHNNTTTNM